MQYLGDINARARGLRTRLLPAHELERVAKAGDLHALERELSSLGYLTGDAAVTPAALERAVRRRASSQMGILHRWCGDPRRGTLAVLFEDEDRRSIQAVLRGAERGIGSEARLSGLVPTITLPERALLALASQPTTADVVRLLVLWRHPLGSPLVGAVSGPRPSLFDIEVALQRAFARRASEHARRGGPHLVGYVEQVIDVMNAWSVLLHFAERDPSMVELTFVEGGRLLERNTFRRLMSLDTQAEARARLAWELRATGIGHVFRPDTGELSELETALLRAEINQQNEAMRADPNGPAPILSYALELRAEVRNLTGIIWGVALRAPSALIQANMVVP